MIVEWYDTSSNLVLTAKYKKMIDIAKLKIGDRVHYVRDNAPEDQYENGMVKEIPDHTNDSVRVVYNCAGDWNNFKNYTSALTRLENLRIGWKH